MEESPLIEYACQVLLDAYHRCKSGECDERKIAYMVDVLNAESKGYYDENTFENYDVAGKDLGIKGRTAMKEYLDKNGVKTKKINGKPVGFFRTEIGYLARRLKISKAKKKE